MKIEFDKNADAVYIELNSGEFAKNKVIDKNTIIDFDKNGNILGIEIINASKVISKDFLSDVIVKGLG